MQSSSIRSRESASAVGATFSHLVSLSQTKSASLYGGYSVLPTYGSLKWLSQRLGQPFVVENRPGAGGNFSGRAVQIDDGRRHAACAVPRQRPPRRCCRTAPAAAQPADRSGRGNIRQRRHSGRGGHRQRAHFRGPDVLDRGWNQHVKNGKYKVTAVKLLFSC